MHCQAGMNVIRCNMSHGDHEEQSMKLANLEKARIPNDGTLKILKTQIFIICRIKMDYISIIKYHQVSKFWGAVILAHSHKFMDGASRN